MVSQLLVVLGLVVAGVATRLVGQLQFNAVGAAFLFSGATMTRKWQAIVAPLAAYFVTDLLLNLQWFGSDTGSWEFSSTSYLLFAATAVLGLALRERPNTLRIGAAATAAAVMFFVVSNFVEWYTGKMYSKDGAGLVACYVAAIPFAGNMLVGNLFFSAVLFGGWRLIQPALVRKAGFQPVLAKN